MFKANIRKSFCPTEKNRLSQFIDEYGYDFEFFESILDIENEWRAFTLEANVFFKFDFLKTVEECPPNGAKVYYCLVRKDQNIIGLLYFQSKFIKLIENLKVGDDEGVVSTIKKGVIKNINFQSFTCGNSMLTGKFGYYFSSNIIESDQFTIVSAASDKLELSLKQKGNAPKLILIKDLWSEDCQYIPESTHNQYTCFEVQPCMLFDIKPEWKSFENYAAELKSKYRVRLKNARKKSENIKKIEFDDKQIHIHRHEIHQLYKQIADQANFNLFTLHIDYFERLKYNLGDAVKFMTYWCEGKLVGFYTSIQNNTSLEAHFLGYDLQENKEHQIYLNMLYDYIEEGVKDGFKQINMSRTAVEIKSTVGAKPHKMNLLLKHTSPTLNKMVGPILNLVKPSQDFIIRHPFKGEED